MITILLCYPNLPNQIVGVPYASLINTITTVAREISKIWNVILLNIIQEPVYKQEMGLLSQHSKAPIQISNN